MTRDQVEMIAREYAAAPRLPNAPEASRVADAYRALQEYTLARFVDLARQEFRTWPETSGEAPDPVVAWGSKALPVYDKMHGHPLWHDRVNYAFRAVHDGFGHRMATAKRYEDVLGFGFENECAAAQEQSADIFAFGLVHAWSEAKILGAQLAAWTEIVGQAAYYEVHGAFPEQKALLMPSLAYLTR